MLASELITSLNKAIAVGGDFEVNDYSPVVVTVEKVVEVPVVLAPIPTVVKPEKVVVKQPGRKRKDK